ncbi:MAG: J domain-containing protein [Deltaproteobacteria bacterium]|nr:J domain-containing protein [Deltaproteobacteria bacterium]
MIFDPYSVLDLPEDAEDEAIRARYLELVRRYPPDHHPERFRAVREAYELVRDGDRRLNFTLFHVVRNPDLKANWEAIEWKPETRRRPKSQELLERLRPRK